MRSVTSIKNRLARLMDEEDRIHIRYYRELGRVLTQEELGECGQETGAIRLEINVLKWVLSTKAPEANKIKQNTGFF